MKSLVTILSLAALFVGITTPHTQANTLGDLMKAEGFNKMMGTWVDQDTKGENVKVVYKWKIKGHAIEMSVMTGDSRSTGLIVLKPGAEEPMHVSVNDKGAVSTGKWTAKDGKAILTISHTNPEGEESEIVVTHEGIDKNTLKITFGRVDSGETGDVTLVRQEKKKKEKQGKKKKDAKGDASTSKEG